MPNHSASNTLFIYYSKIYDLLFFDCFILSSTIDYFNTENTKFTEDEQSFVVLGTDYELF